MRSRLLSIRYLVIAIVFLFSTLSQNEAKACHAGAADMWITYVGPGIDGCTGTTSYDYLITVRVYNPCQTCTLVIGPTGERVEVYSPSLPSFGTQYVPLVDVNGASADPDTISSLCPIAYDSNSCKHVGQLPYINLYPASRYRELTGTITLPSAQFDWTFQYNIAGAGRITTVNMPGCSGVLWIQATLNNVNKYNNSTPRFTSNPLPYICLNQPTTYLNSPFDVNGDSMVVIQQAPFFNNAAGVLQPCTFPGPATAPFTTLADPIGSAASNPYTLNPTTGAATFTPTLGVGPYILAFRCDEYERNSGVLLGSVGRDVQVSILPCSSPPPNIDSLKPNLTVFDGKVVKVRSDNTTQAGQAIVTCPGNNMKFTLSSKGTPGHNLYMYANTDQLTGSTFTVAGEGKDSIIGTFSWTPSVADIGEKTLTITSADSTCNANQPIVLYNYTVIYIKIIAGLDAGRDLLTCNLNPPRKQLFVKGFGNLELQVKWSDVGGGPARGIDYDTSYTPTVAGPGGTEYVVYSPDLSGQCKVRDTVMLINDTSNTVDIFPQTDRYVMCRPGYLQLDAVTTGGNPVDNVKCDTLPVFNCPTNDSITIWGSTAFGNNIAYDTAGTSSPILYGDVLSSRYQFLINKQELREYGMRSGTIKSISFETAKNSTDPLYEYSNFTIYMKCTDKSKLSKATGFETGMVKVYEATGPMSFANGWHNFVLDKPYNWDTTKGLIIGICYNNNAGVLGPCSPSGAGAPGVIKFMPTTYVSTMTLKAPDATTTDMCNANTLADIKETTVRPIFGLTFCDAPGLPFYYNWYPGNLLSDSTIKAPLTYVQKTTTYQVVTAGKNGCNVADTMEVYVPTHDFSVWPADTSICYGQTAQLEVRKGTYYQWFEYEEGKYISSHNTLSCGFCANPVAKPLKSTHYKIMVGDEVFCYDTIDAYVEVRPLPNVKIMTRDTVVKYGQSVELLATGGKLYNWTPVGSLNNPNISYPIATPTEPTMYVVSGISSTGCYAYDTVRVGINYRDNLQIPTAFSPNGDGKNDIFHITNLTFQRIVEFKVFNRWGQQVYSGSGDARTGWDGMWKGVPQELGNYQYLIRVGYPDGLVETYKGDVTLVR